jgi:hypothetical protein
MSTVQMETVDLGDRKVQIYELTVGQIKKFWRELATFDISKLQLAGLTPGMKEVWDAAVQGITFEDLDNYRPSEIKKVADAFQKANSVFFDLAKSVEGENPMLRSLRVALISDLMNRFAGLSAQATPEDQTESGVTDTDSSAPPSTS